MTLELKSLKRNISAGLAYAFTSGIISSHHRSCLDVPSQPTDINNKPYNVDGREEMFWISLGSWGLGY